MHCTSQKINKISMKWKLIFLYKTNKHERKKGTQLYSNIYTTSIRRLYNDIMFSLDIRL